MFTRRGVVAGSIALAAASRVKAEAVAGVQPAAVDDWAGAALILARVQPPRFPNRDFPIVAYGANLDVPAHQAVQAAVDACSAAGGGRVVVPAGLWVMNGPVHLRSNVDLHLERGATLRFGKPDEIELPMVLTRWEGTEVYNFSPLIYARDCENIAITGDGLLDGQGKDGFYHWRGRQGRDKEALRDMGATGVPLEQRRFGPGHFLRPAFVQFFECRNVTIDGPKFVDSPFWTIHPVYCRNVIVRNVTVISHHLNSDAVDPDSCEDVLIERSRFDVADDCIAIKSGRDQDGRRIGRPTRNVVIRDCELSTGIAAAIAIGSEMSGGASNIYAERLTVRRAKHALYFKANMDRGGVIEQVRVRNVQVGETDTLVNFTTAYHRCRGGDFPPTYKAFTVEDVHCRDSGAALHIVGVSEAPVDDVLIRRVTVATASRPDTIAHTRDLRLDRVRVNGLLMSA